MWNSEQVNRCKACKDQISPFREDWGKGRYNRTEYCRTCFLELTQGRIPKNRGGKPK